VASERLILNEILARSGALWPFARLWRNNTGTARSFDGRRVIAFGLTGSADIIGILNDGRFLAIETKAPRGWLSEPQQRFRDMIQSQRGVYIVARSISDVTEALAAHGYPDRSIGGDTARMGAHATFGQAPDSQGLATSASGNSRASPRVGRSRA